MKKQYLIYITPESKIALEETFADLGILGQQDKSFSPGLNWLGKALSVEAGGVIIDAMAAVLERERQQGE